jgi:uncharacterized membrane protein
MIGGVLKIVFVLLEEIGQVLVIGGLAKGISLFNLFRLKRSVDGYRSTRQ